MTPEEIILDLETQTRAATELRNIPAPARQALRDAVDALIEAQRILAETQP